MGNFTQELMENAMLTNASLEKIKGGEEMERSLRKTIFTGNLFNQKINSLILFLLFCAQGWGATIQNVALTARNTPSADAANWTFTNATINNSATDYWKMITASAGSVVTSPSMNFSSYTGITVTVVTSSFGTITAANQDYLKLEYWNGTIWSQITFGNSTSYASAISLPYTYASAKIRFTATNASGTAGVRLTSILITGTPAATLTAATLTSSISNTYGTASTGVSFTATGTNLTGNITATAQTGFAVSTTLGSGYTTSVSVASGTTVYVQSTATKTAGDFNGTTAVVLSGGGAASSANITTSSSGNTVTAKALTIASAAATNKTYDRTNSATITGSLSGIVNSDVVNLSGTGTFAQIGVGTGIAVTSNSTLAGAGAGNYSLTQPTSLTADITAKALTVSSAAASNKTYDGSNTASITGGSLVGVITSDVVTLSQTGTFAQTTIGTGIAVTSTSTLGGADAGNYTLTQPTGLSANITAKTLTISGITANDKIYDGTATGSASGTPTLIGVIGVDDVTLGGTGSYSFASASVGAGKTVSTSGFSISGAQSTNYSLTQPTLSAAITVRNLTITANNDSKTYGQSKTYGAGLTSFTSSGLQNSETIGTITITASGGTAANGAVGSYNLTPSLASGGTFNTGNYNISYVNGTLTVGTANLSITANDVIKSLGATLNGGPGSIDFTSSGLQNSETIGSVTISYLSGADAADPVGLYSGQIVPSDAIGGSFNPTNYNISYVNGNITITNTPTIIGSASATAFTTTYGTASSPQIFAISGSALTANIIATAPTGFEVSNDGTTYGTTANFAQTGGSASGNLYIRLAATAPVGGSYNSQNISLSSSSATTVYITSASSGNTVSSKGLTISGISISNKTYDGNTTATISGTASYSGLVNGETFSVAGTPVAIFADKDVANGKSISISGYLAPSANYSLTQPNSLTANITAKTLTISGATASNKTYDRTNTASIAGGSLVGIISPDIVTLSQTGTFAQSVIGTAIAVTSTSTLGGAGASNYSLTQPTGLSADITAKALTVSGASVTSKIYTGTNNASITGASLVGVISPDVVTVSGGGTFADVNVANGISVTAALSLSGTDASNYTLTQPTGLTGNITAAALTITGLTGVNKDYDGNTTSSFTGTAAYSGLVNGETFSVTGTPSASFATNAAGNAKTITIAGFTAPSNNYTLTQPTLTGNINKVVLTITAANQTVVAGTAIATVTGAGSYTATGFVNSETASVISGSATYTTSYTTSTAAGTAGVTITPVVTGLIANNYSFTAANGTITITPAPEVLAGWDFSTIVTTDNYGVSPMAATTASSNISVGGLTRGSGFGALGAAGVGAAWGATNFTVSGDLAGEIAANKFYTLSITANSGKLVTLTSISAYNIRKSASGPTTGQWQYRIGSGTFINIGSPITWGSITSSTGNAQIAVDLSGIADLSLVPSSSTITIRLVSYGATNTGGTNYLKDLGNTTGNDLIINGIINTPITPPTLTADATSNNVDNNLDITFTDDATWRSKITAVKIGSTTLTASTDYVISAGNIQLKPSGANAVLTASGSKSLTIVATGYSDASVIQLINAGAPTANSTATISAILAAGASRTITCTAKDQYNNLVSGYTFKYDAAIVSSVAATTESYVIDGSSITATANNIDLVATTNSSGVATFIATLPTTIDATDGISIQVQLSNGSTNIGSAFTYYELPGQTINFSALSAKTYGDASYSISATGGASGNPVTFTSSDPSVATCSGTNGATITILKQGTTTIYANQAGNSSYNAAAQVGQSLLINPKGLTITGLTGVSRVYNGTTTATFTGTAAYAGLVNSETFAVTGTPSASFADANVGTAKTITVSGYTAPSANYSLTQPTLTADITQATQTITFSTLPNRNVSGNSFNLTLNASSGLPINYVSSDPSVVSISGNTVTIVGVGTTTITASQAGNSNYSAATSVDQSQTILPIPIAGWDFYGQSSPATFAATTFSSNLVSSSGASNITRGSSAATNGTANSFSTTGFQNNGISTANTDYFQITLTPNSGYLTSLSSINANFDGTASFYASPGVTSQYAYSLDGTNFTLIGSPVTSTSLKPAEISLSGVSDLQNVAGKTITIRYYASGQTTTGGWRFYSPSAGVNGLSIGGSVDAIPTNDWIGGSGTWNTASNWSLSRVPLSTDNITISNGSPVMDVNHTLDNARTLTISGTGTLTINPAITLTIAGTADFGGKSVTLKSTAAGTGAIGQITGTLTGASIVTVERYIPANGRRYRYLAAPFATGPSINSSWQNNIFITGSGTGGTTCASASASGPVQHTNGFDATNTNSPSMYTFNEATAIYNQTTSGVDYYTNAWTSVANTNSTNLSAGKGYNIYIRGDRAQGCSTLVYPYTTANAVTLSATGTVQSGTFTFTTTYNSGNGNGYNLLGNPYPSEIDWDASSGWTKTNISNVLYMYNPITDNYGSYTSAGTIGVNGGMRYIPSGTAFFIKATGSPTLSCTEAVKTTTNATPLLKGNKPFSIRLNLSYSNGRKDESLVILNQDQTDGLDDMFDIEKMANPSNVNIYSIDASQRKYAINAIANIADETEKILPLGVGEANTGNYTLHLEAPDLPSYYIIFLRDHYLNQEQQLFVGDSINYNFTVTNDTLSAGNSRFDLYIGNKRPHSTGLSKLPRLADVKVYPNPSKDLITVSMPVSAQYVSSLVVYNVMGQMLKTIEHPKMEEQINLGDLGAGIYFLSFVGNGQVLKTVKVCKN